jgi:hypothetical protein
MSNLTISLNALQNFLEERGIAPTTLDVRIVEIGPDVEIDEHGRFHVKRTEIRTVAEYEERFNELLDSGLPWLNMSCYGVDDGKMLVAVEVPRSLSKSSLRTSVNYSGPVATVLEADWKVDSVLVFE